MVVFEVPPLDCVVVAVGKGFRPDRDLNRVLMGFEQVANNTGYLASVDTADGTTEEFRLLRIAFDGELPLYRRANTLPNRLTGHHGSNESSAQVLEHRFDIIHR